MDNCKALHVSELLDFVHLSDLVELHFQAVIEEKQLVQIGLELTHDI